MQKSSGRLLTLLGLLQSRSMWSGAELADGSRSADGPCGTTSNGYGSWTIR